MEYFYFPPFKKQFFFPLNKQSEKLYYFYHPYSSKAKFIWKLWKNFNFLRNIFSVQEEKIPIQIDTIKTFLNHGNFLFALNKGTPGIEQKTSVIALEKNTNEIHFLKCSVKSKAKELSRNEIKILNKLGSKYNFIPSLIKYQISKDKIILMTEYFEGDKYKTTELDDDILKTILLISKINVNDVNTYGKNDSIKCFNHGDFCPWNLLIDHNNIKIIDWEMAGYYPLGYDLFTFIFQTNFLLSSKTIHKILNSNKKYIIEYFKIYDIINWKPYLKEFASIKLRFEKEKNDSKLLKHYQKLIYYEKT